MMQINPTNMKLGAILPNGAQIIDLVVNAYGDGVVMGRTRYGAPKDSYVVWKFDNFDLQSTHSGLYFDQDVWGIHSDGYRKAWTAFCNRAESIVTGCNSIKMEVA